MAGGRIRHLAGAWMSICCIIKTYRRGKAIALVFPLVVLHACWLRLRAACVILRYVMS